MKKHFSTLIAFFVIWAISFCIVFLINVMTCREDSSGIIYYITIGFGAALAGWLGPIISDFVCKKIKKS